MAMSDVPATMEEARAHQALAAGNVLALRAAAAKANGNELLSELLAVRSSLAFLRAGQSEDPLATSSARPEGAQEEALAQLAPLLAQLAPLMRQAGIAA